MKTVKLSLVEFKKLVGKLIKEVNTNVDSITKEIAISSGLQPSAISAFIAKYNVDSHGLLQAMKHGKISGSDVATAISGRELNKYAKYIMRTFQNGGK